MKKALTIAIKDFTIVFRDPAALMMMLVTPFALTLVIAFAFGGLGDEGQFSQIPVVVVDQDAGDYGALLRHILAGEELSDLILVTRLDSVANARASVDADLAAAAIIIPPDFSATISAALAEAHSDAPSPDRPQGVIEVYGNPTRPISSGIVRSIVEEFITRLTAGIAGAQVSLTQLVQSGRVSPQDAAVLQEIGQRASEQAAAARLITLHRETAADAPETFDWLTYMAPSMAVMFLMFTVASGGRSILTERDERTLPRILTTPTTPAQVLGGKIFGIFLTGVIQIAILVIASTVLFGVYWGALEPLVLVIGAVVAAATGWGTLLAAFCRSPGQANALGSAGVMTFAALAGNYLPRHLLPTWIQQISYISPNAWALEAFAELAAGGTLADVRLHLMALSGMAVVLFIISILAFRRQYD